MEDIAESGCRLLKNQDKLFPLRTLDQIILLEPERPGFVESPPDDPARAAGELSRLWNIPLRIIRQQELPADNPASVPASLTEPVKGKNLLLFTENAHLTPVFRRLTQDLAGLTKSLFLAALKNPYDADIPGVRNALCSYGFISSQQKALIKKLKPPESPKSRE